MRKLLILVSALALASCQAAAPPAETPAAPKAGPSCLDFTQDAKHIAFGEGEDKLVGIVWGKGTTGIVLAHQNGGSICQWLEPARDLVAKGYLVLAFDFGGSPLGTRTRVEEVTAATNAIRAQGATKVVLVGASMGGTFSVAAAPTITPPVQAVVSLSAPTAFGAADAEQAAPKLTMPVLWLAGAHEYTYSAGAEKMHAAAKASPKSQLVIAAGSPLHGVSLVTKDVGPQDAIDAFAAFLTAQAPPS